MNTDPANLSQSPFTAMTYKAFHLGGMGPHMAWRGLMFSIELKNGNRSAFPYAYIQRIDVDLSGSISVEMPEITIVFQGRNLVALYEALLDHTVRTITEADVVHQTSPDGESWISRVDSESKNGSRRDDAGEVSADAG